jgi:hypothetical protein
MKHVRSMHGIAIALGLLAFAGSAHAATLRGRVVVVPAHEPGVGLWIRVERVGEAIDGFPAGKPSPDDEEMTAYTDAKGEFELDHLPPGMYEVAIQAESLPRKYTTVGRPKRTVLVYEEDRSNVTLEVSTHARLVGQVTREDGLPTRGCQIVLLHKGERVILQKSETDDTGSFQVPGLEPGVPVIVEARAPEGVYRRAETTPLHAGDHHFEMKLPVWNRTARQKVVLDVAIPRVGESPLTLLWRSLPLDAPQGFTVEVPMSREGRAELETPTGVYSVRVQEMTARKRRWEAERYYRVAETQGAVHINVTVQEISTETASLQNR